jgi:hypothetical protein
MSFTSDCHTELVKANLTELLKNPLTFTIASKFL